MAAVPGGRCAGQWRGGGGGEVPRAAPWGGVTPLAQIVGGARLGLLSFGVFR